MGEKQDSDLFTRISSFQTKIIESTKNYHSLAFLGSLSLVIASFSDGKFISAQEYAITASMCFLLAFIICLINGVFSTNPWLLLLSTSFLLFGFVFLLLVSWEYIKAVEIANQTYYLVKTLSFAILYGYISSITVNEIKPHFKQLTKKSEKIFLILIIILLAISTILMITDFAINTYNFLMHKNINISANYFTISLVSLAFGAPYYHTWTKIDSISKPEMEKLRPKFTYVSIFGIMLFLISFPIITFFQSFAYRTIFIVLILLALIDFLWANIIIKFKVLKFIDNK
nr:hypothetical protein [uncultured Methanolobus sp.]